MTSFADSLSKTQTRQPVSPAESPNHHPKKPVDKNSTTSRHARGLHALHQFIPRDIEGGSEFRGHLNGWCVLARLNHLNISTADISLFSKLLLGHLSRISQAINVLTEAAIFRLTHSSSFMKTQKSQRSMLRLFNPLLQWTIL